MPTVFPTFWQDITIDRWFPLAHSMHLCWLMQILYLDLVKTLLIHNALWHTMNSRHSCTWTWMHSDSWNNGHDIHYGKYADKNDYDIKSMEYDAGELYFKISDLCVLCSRTKEQFCKAVEGALIDFLVFLLFYETTMLKNNFLLKFDLITNLCQWQVLHK